ncbi:MAG TPA: ribonuclease Z [Gemmatimonadaceae bacterium]|nr:ribonuclease Z [Gemmatimonadaceae bacterium]
MSLSVLLLGTSASRPTVERNVSALALVREGETMLFDCGEGTQRQMMRYGVSFSLSDIFFTHFHADHVIGVIGLMRTMALQGRTDTMRLWGPRGAERHLKRAEQFGVDRLTFPVEIHELDAGETVPRKEYAIRAFAVEHGPGPSMGYALVEDDRKGRFDPEHARALGVPEGPLWGRIHKGEDVTLDSGVVVKSAELVGPRRPGRTVVVTGDTRPCENTIEAARNADLLVHEATFGDEEAERAVETGHSTAREAAVVARKAGCRRLVLSHFSARYSRDASELETQARAEFPNVTIGRDGMEIDVPFPNQ